MSQCPKKLRVSRIGLPHSINADRSIGHHVRGRGDRCAYISENTSENQFDMNVNIDKDINAGKNLQRVREMSYLKGVFHFTTDRSIQCQTFRTKKMRTTYDICSIVQYFQTKTG